MGVEGSGAAESPQAIAFASFRLDLRSGQLSRAGTPIALRPKTWALLRSLATRPGVLMSKEELLNAVWRDVAVTPDTLTESIGELRIALGDDATTPRFIETVHRRGFRFIGKTSDVLVGDEDAVEWSERPVGVRPFVGRRAELTRLAERLKDACAGERQVVFVTGPGGIGKTTLVEAFLESSAFRRVAQPIWVARGACVDQHGLREPYLAVLKAVEWMARRTDAQGLVGLLRRTGPTWLAQMPWLVGDDAEALRHSLRAARAERMLREFAAFVEALTAEVPLVLVLEDLHWSDPATLDVLSLLGQGGLSARLLVIGTYRPNEVHVQEHALAQAVRRLQLHGGCAELALHELSEEDVRSYLEARFPGAEVPPGLASVVHQRTDGRPLFVVAVVDHLISRGLILDSAPGWSFAAALDATHLDVPADARRIIGSQLESLAPDDRRLLRAAAVVGHEFVAQAIAAPLRYELEDVEARCEVLARPQRFLRFAGSSDWPDGRVALRYAFTHQLYRQAVYDAMPAGSRRRLHQHIGETLEAAYGDRSPEIAAALATHFERSGDGQRAIRHLAVAAARAQERFAGREAITYLEAAIAVATRLPIEGERRRQELELRIALAPLLSDMCGFASDELVANCERAHDLCGEVGNSAQLFQVLYALCHFDATRADTLRAPARIQALDDLARRLGTVGHRLLADTVLARSAVQRGCFADACRVAEAALSGRLASGISDPGPPLGADPAIAINCQYAYALWFLGHTDRARTTMLASLAAARRPGISMFTQAAALTLMAVLELLNRNPAKVQVLAGQVGVIAAEHGFRFWSPIAAALRGWAQLHHDELHAGIEELEGARVAHAATGARIFLTHILAFLAEGHRLAGEWAAGLTAVDEGLRVAETTLERSYWPELWRLKGELLLAVSVADRTRARGGSSRREPADDPRWEEAERCLHHALQLAREQGARSLELRAATSLARLWHDQGKRAEARDLLAPVYAWFTEGFDTRDLIDAKALLAELR